MEEQFIKPYLTKYGVDLLDVVSVHWYGTNDHGFQKLWAKEPPDSVLTMAHKKELTFLMDHTNDFEGWTRTMATLLQDRKLNPQSKHIGIFYSEADVNAISPYQKNPINTDWPRYRAAADCWLNANYFRGVWWASTLCHITTVGAEANVFKFTIRNYYGLADESASGHAYRFPVWFALKLLKDQGGLAAGRRMLATSLGRESDPAVEAFATGGPHDLRIILINKSFGTRIMDLDIGGLRAGQWKATRCLFDCTRVAHFRGRKPSKEQNTADGTFDGYPNGDAVSEACLKPVDTLDCHAEESHTWLKRVTLPPISFTILAFQKYSPWRTSP